MRPFVTVVALARLAALLQQIFEVDPLACPTCHGPMPIKALITETSVIDQILTPLRARHHRGAQLEDGDEVEMTAYAEREGAVLAESVMTTLR